MYLSSTTYEDINEDVFDFVNDWGFYEYPVSMQHVCKKIGLKLKPYSELDEGMRQLAMDASEDAFHPVSNYLQMNNIVVAYNDSKSNCRIRFNIAHELGHIVREHIDESPWNEKEADYFGGYLLAPIPLVLAHCPELGISDIAEFFCLSFDCAKVVRDHCRNRIACGKPKLPYELGFIEMCSVKGVKTLDVLKQSNRQV